jgi:hypothetical protein
MAWQNGIKNPKDSRRKAANTVRKLAKNERRG